MFPVWHTPHLSKLPPWRKTLRSIMITDIRLPPWEHRKCISSKTCFNLLFCTSTNDTRQNIQLFREQEEGTVLPSCCSRRRGWGWSALVGWVLVWATHRNWRRTGWTAPGSVLSGKQTSVGFIVSCHQFHVELVAALMDKQRRVLLGLNTGYWGELEGIPEETWFWASALKHKQFH